MTTRRKKRSYIDPDLVSKVLGEVLDKAFLFFTDIGEYTGISAISLSDFCDKLDKVPLRSVEFHFNRGDFGKWIKETLGDKQLAARIGRIKKKVKGEELKKKIQGRVRRRLTQLKTSI